MYTNSTLFLVFLFLITLRINGQEAQEEYQNVILNLMSGDTVIYKLSENNSSHITGFKKKTNKDIWKFKIFSEDEVAFYTYSNGEKNWMYQTNPKIGQFLKRDEMEQYILGKRDAKFNYKPIKYFVGSLFFGLVVGGIDTYKKNEGILSKSNSVLSLSVPLISSTLFITKKNKFNNRLNMNEKQNLEYHYSNGFNASKKTKNNVASFTGSLFGVLVVILLNNY